MAGCRVHHRVLRPSPPQTMEDSTTSAPRSASSSVVSASAVQILLDSLVVAQPFQSGGSLADDLLVAFEILQLRLGELRSSTDYALSAICKRLDNPKRFKNKCELIATHRYDHIGRKAQDSVSPTFECMILTPHCSDPPNFRSILFFS
jgi:hypothetical protein